MVLIPLCGSGTRGDQVDNARFFESFNAADVLVGQDATAENLKSSLEKMLEPSVRSEYSSNVRKLTGDVKPAEKIAEILYNQLKNR